jgi:uncharacterized damage-inducible protein DinB
MKMKDYLLAELEREVDRSRRALEQAPDGKYDWKPHEKSMIFGYLANMVATIPSWITMQIAQDELDVAPASGSNFEQKRLESSTDLISALNRSAADAKAAFEKTTDEHLNTPWRLLTRGKVVMEAPRFEMIQDTISHWSHHRGQMTVYLRLWARRSPPSSGPPPTTTNSASEVHISMQLRCHKPVKVSRRNEGTVRPCSLRLVDRSLSIRTRVRVGNPASLSCCTHDVGPRPFARCQRMQ